MRVSNRTNGVPYLQSGSDKQVAPCDPESSYTSFKDILDIKRRSSSIADDISYNNKAFIPSFRFSESIKRTPHVETFKAVKVDFQCDEECRVFDSYRDKLDGSGKMLIRIRLVGCSENDKIDEKELADAFRKISSGIDKYLEVCKKMGGTQEDGLGGDIQYNKATGKINTREFLTGLGELAELVLGKLAVDKKSRNYLEMLRKELDEYVFKMIDGEEPLTPENVSSNEKSQKLVLVEELKKDLKTVDSMPNTTPSV